MATREPVLNLNTLVEHRVVRIDGVDYELLNVGELSILHYHQLGRRSARVQALVEATEHTDDQVAELVAALDWLARVILKAPDEVHARLRDTHRLAILQTFTNLQRENATAPATEGGAPSTSTGETTSPDSSASMGVLHSTGSRRSRKRS